MKKIILVTLAMTLSLSAQALLRQQHTAEAGCAKPVSLVMVHGFNGSEDTWSRWVELIQKDTSLACLNLYNFSYETGFSKTEPRINEIAGALRGELAALSAQGPELFLMAHSMGGLVIKEAILQDRAAPQFLPKLRQVFFIASPHSGLRRPIALFVGAKSAQVKELRRPKIRRLRREWRQGAEGLPVTFSAVVGTRDQVVPRYSARGGFDDVLALPKDHVGVKSPDSEESALYQKVTRALSAAMQ